MACKPFAPARLIITAALAMTVPLTAAVACPAQQRPPLETPLPIASPTLAASAQNDGIGLQMPALRVSEARTRSDAAARAPLLLAHLKETIGGKTVCIAPLYAEMQAVAGIWQAAP